MCVCSKRVACDAVRFSASRLSSTLSLACWACFQTCSIDTQHPFVPVLILVCTPGLHECPSSFWGFSSSIPVRKIHAASVKPRATYLINAICVDERLRIAANLSVQSHHRRRNFLHIASLSVLHLVVDPCLCPTHLPATFGNFPQAREGAAATGS